MKSVISEASLVMGSFAKKLGDQVNWSSSWNIENEQVGR